MNEGTSNPEMTMNLSKSQIKTVETLRAAGALETAVDWRALKLRGGTMKALASRGAIVEPEGGFEYSNRYYGGGLQVPKLVRLAPAVVAAEAPKKAAKMTCPACFRAMSVKMGQNHDGSPRSKIVRHGWREVGGGYMRGRGWHTGSCLGATFRSYEESADGTEYALKVISRWLADTEADLAALEARPATISATIRVFVKGEGYRNERIELEDDGVALEDAPTFGEEQKRSYAHHLAVALHQTGQEIEGLRSDVATLEKALADWKPAGMFAPAPEVEAAAEDLDALPEIAELVEPEAKAWDAMNGREKYAEAARLLAALGATLTFDGAAYLVAAADGTKGRFATLEEAICRD